MRHTKILSLLLCLALVLTLLPGMHGTAYADGVWYLYYASEEAAIAQSATQGSADCTIVESSESGESEVTWNSGWYVVQGTDPVEIGSRITVNGNVHLILADGATLYANKGITVSSGKSLSIYGQNLGTGELIATSSEFNAAIGGYFIYNQASDRNAGSITIHGGKVTASIDGSHQNGCGAAIGGSANGSGGTITINGGVIVAANTYRDEYLAGAAIGGGSEKGAGTITINGGTVTATGGNTGAAIGCGVTDESSGIITINGGTVTATGGDYGAGIGDSAGVIDGSSSSVSIFINDGTVIATGGFNSAGIGGGYLHVPGTVNIKGGVVSAVGGIIEGETGRCPGIGGGYESSDNGTVVLGNDVTVYAGDSENPTTEVTRSSFESDHTQPYVRTVAAIPTIPVTGVSLDKTDAQTVTVGGNVAFTATVAPDGATDKTVKWSVGGMNTSAVKLYSDADCSTEVGTDATDTLTVYAKGISAGIATITVSTTDGNFTASCAVTVTPATISSVAVTGIDAPAAGQNLDTTAESETANVTLSAVAFEPESEDGKASYATVYKAAVTATAAENYAFADNTSATVNGNTAVVTKNQNGTLTISYTFEKTALHPVEIGTSNVEMPYSPDGVTVPLDMFKIPEGAGAATYSVTNGTGEGTYNAETNTLTVTKCGTFTVSVKTAATDTHSAGAATATLTVNKLNLSPTVTIEGWTIGETPKTPNVTGNPGSGAVTYTYKAKGAEDSAYSATVPSAAGEYTVKADIAATENYNAASATADFTIANPTFGPADFTLPASTRTIGDNAFESAAMKSVDAWYCTAIGAGAFKNCEGLQQIRLPENCTIDATAFEDCGTVYVFAHSGGTTETWCQGKANIVFVSLGVLS